MILGFSVVQRPPKCSPCPFYVCHRTYSNVSCQLGIIPGSGRRHGQETWSDQPIPSSCHPKGNAVPWTRREMLFVLGICTKHFFDLDTDPWPSRFYGTHFSLLVFWCNKMLSQSCNIVDLGSLLHAPIEYKRVVSSIWSRTVAKC